MSTRRQIKVLCAMAGISEAELARRLNTSRQAFCAKMKTQHFTVEELDVIATAAGAKLEARYIFPDGKNTTIF